MNDLNIEKVAALEAKAIHEIKQALADNPDDIAGLLIEPIQAEGGDNHFRPEFFAALRELADENEFLLLVDEVQTGFGLTGTFWGHEQMNVEVDGLAFGKKMQVCGILGGRRVEEVDENVFSISSRINSTWGGNLVDMARSRLYLEIFEEENILEHVRITGEHLLGRIQRMEREMGGLISNARGRGLMCAFDLADGSIRKEVLDAALADGVFILGCGNRSIRFRPALNIPRDVLEEGIARLERALRAVAAKHPSESSAKG